MDILGLLGGDSTADALADATWRGVPFSMPNVSHPAGRRIKEFLFPGIDARTFQDLGQLDGDFTVPALLIDDDYIRIGSKFETAFQTPGPGTLVHPWLGSIDLVLIQPATITYSSDELRTVRFQMVFARLTPRTTPADDTQQTLLGELQAMRNAAGALLDQVLGTVSQVLSVVGYVRGFAGMLQGFWRTAVGSVSGITSELIGPACSGAVTGLGVIPALPLGIGFAPAVAAALAAPSAAVVGASQPIIPSAVAPGGVLTTAPAADPRIATTMLLGLVTTVGTTASAAAPAPAIALVTQSLILADALTAASDIVFTSQQDAAIWAARLQAALDALANAAMLLGVTYPTTAGTVWRAALAAKEGLAADMNAAIGRLPAVLVLTPPAQVPVWLLAQYLAGDTPDQVFAVYQDVVARNGIYAPYLAPAGPLEVLDIWD